MRTWPALYGLRANPATGSFPQGSIKDETTPGVSNDGTPLDSNPGNDREAFFQKALQEAGITPDGTADSVTKSQIWDALRKGLFLAAGSGTLITNGRVEIDTVANMQAATWIDADFVGRRIVTYAYNQRVLSDWTVVNTSDPTRHQLPLQNGLFADWNPPTGTADLEFSVAHFGAYGDYDVSTGSGNDDTPFAQDCIDKSPRGASIIWPPTAKDRASAIAGLVLEGRRKYVFPSASESKANIVVPNGSAATWCMAADRWFYSRNDIDLDDGREIEIENLAMYGNRPTTPGTLDGLILSNYRPYLKNCYLSGFTGSAVKMPATLRNGDPITYQAVGAFFDKVRFLDCAVDGLFAEGDMYSDVWVRSCGFSNIDGNGVNTARGSGWTIDSLCHFDTCRTNCIRVLSATGITISGNYFEPWGSAGVGYAAVIAQLRGTATIVGNYGYHNADDFVVFRVDAADDVAAVSLTGNSFRTTGLNNFFSEINPFGGNLLTASVSANVTEGFVAPYKEIKNLDQFNAAGNSWQKADAAPAVGKWFLGDVIERKTPAPGTNARWINFGTGAPGSWTVDGQVGVRSASGSPIGVLTPLTAYEEYFDTTNTKWYKATGTATSNDWVALN